VRFALIMRDAADARIRSDARIPTFAENIPLGGGEGRWSRRTRSPPRPLPACQAKLAVLTRLCLCVSVSLCLCLSVFLCAPLSLWVSLFLWTIVYAWYGVSPQRLPG
jgi:hypothetical protein